MTRRGAYASSGVAVDRLPFERIAWIPTLLRKGSQRLRSRHLQFTSTKVPLQQRYFFVLDCSASMLRQGGLAWAKGVLLTWLRQLRRDRAEAVLICFGGDRADRRFGPALPTGWNESWIEPIGGGGGTPLTLGLSKAASLMLTDTGSRKGRRQCLVLLTDGRTVAQPPRPEGYDEIIIVDAERGPLALGRCVSLAEQWGAAYRHIDAWG